MAGGRKKYWERSCPRCGKPSIEQGRNALNKVGPPGTSKKARCVVCKKPLEEI